MKIIEGLKKLIPKKLLNKKSQSHKDACRLILKLINKESKTCTNKPEGMSKEEWRNILNDMSFVFKVKAQDITLKSPARRKQREQKVNRAFELFKVYIKHL
tara:strand:- start:640 stop:942 length:303 start_codon:yes stop_codon:yes gene_type:complete